MLLASRIENCPNWALGWAKILVTKCLGCQKLSLGSLLTKKNFFWKNVQNPATYSGVEISRLPLKFPFLKIFKIIVESSLIAHLIGNFILKNIKTGHFLIKLISDEICRHMWFYDVIYEYDVISRQILVLSKNVQF